MPWLWSQGTAWAKPHFKAKPLLHLLKLFHPPLEAFHLQAHLALFGMHLGHRLFLLETVILSLIAGLHHQPQLFLEVLHALSL